VRVPEGGEARREGRVVVEEGADARVRVGEAGEGIRRVVDELKGLKVVVVGVAHVKGHDTGGERGAEGETRLATDPCGRGRGTRTSGLKYCKLDSFLIDPTALFTLFVKV